MNESHIGETCDTCGTKVMPILWGMPTEEGLADAKRNGWHIGGCCIDERMSRCECGALSYDDDGHLVDAGSDW